MPVAVTMTPSMSSFTPNGAPLAMRVGGSSRRTLTLLTGIAPNSERVALSEVPRGSETLPIQRSSGYCANCTLPAVPTVTLSGRRSE